MAPLLMSDGNFLHTDCLPWKEKILQLDPIGTVVFIPSITCLFAAVQLGSTNYGWSDWRVITLFVIFAILIIGFGLIQWK